MRLLVMWACRPRRYAIASGEFESTSRLTLIRVREFERVLACGIRADCEAHRFRPELRSTVAVPGQGLPPRTRGSQTDSPHGQAQCRASRPIEPLSDALRDRAAVTRGLQLANSIKPRGFDERLIRMPCTSGCQRLWIHWKERMRRVGSGGDRDLRIEASVSRKSAGRPREAHPPPPMV
mgnify:FL=1